jgi:hypothetical protein
VTGPGIYTPIAPGVTYANLPVAPSVVDTSPDQMIGCIVTVADNPQGRLDALFPSAVDGDGVIDRATNDIWVYNGTTWDNAGPTPGPTIVATVVIPPWNEIVRVSARTRTKLTVTSLPYALTLLTEPDPIITRTALTVTPIRKISVPATAIATAATAPQVSISATVFAPASAIALAPAAPSVVIEIPPGVPVPATAIELAAPVPQISAGVSVAVAATDIALAAPVPSIVLVTPDPNFSSVELLLHMDGTNGSTTFTDSSSNSLTVTANGNAQISTAQSKFGGASGLFDGNGDYLLVPADGTAIGTGDFTIEGWIRTIAGNGYRCIVSLDPSSDNNSLYVISNAIIWYDSGDRCQSTTFSNDVWYHVAVTRSSGTVRVFLDGTVSGTTFSSTANIGNNTTRISTRGAATGEWFHGYIDDLRITKGVARYTANFTAPTAPFPDS